MEKHRGSEAIKFAPIWRAEGPRGRKAGILAGPRSRFGRSRTGPRPMSNPQPRILKDVSACGILGMNLSRPARSWVYGLIETGSRLLAKPATSLSTDPTPKPSPREVQQCLG